MYKTHLGTPKHRETAPSKFKLGGHDSKFYTELVGQQINKITRKSAVKSPPNRNS